MSSLTATEGWRQVRLCVVAGWLVACTSVPRPTTLESLRPVEVQKKDVVRLEFKPLVGKRLVETSSTLRTEMLPMGVSVDEPSPESVVARTATEMSRRPDGTFVLHQRVLAIEALRGGKRVQNELADAATRYVLRIQLAADGTFVRLMNPQDVQAAIQPLLKRRGGARLRELFTSEAIEARAREDWTAKYGGLFGANLTVGSALYSTESVVTSAGRELWYLVERTVAGVGMTEQGEALVLTLRCSGAPREGTPKDAVRLPPNAVLEPSVTCEGQQIVAVNAFVPVRSWMKLAARPDGPVPVEVKLFKEALTTGIE